MDPEVQAIKTKVLNSPWPKFLKSVTIGGLRGWAGEEVKFQFPVVAIAGENGSGKSTVLKAAAAAYMKAQGQAESYYPSVFFPDTPWEKVTGAKLVFKVTEGTNERTVRLTHVTERWNFTPKEPAKRPKRYVTFQDISRTVPIEATVGYARIAQRNATETAATNLTDVARQQYSAILGRQYETARFAKSSVDSKRTVGVVKANGNEYSLFHSGAGEDATFDLMAALESIPDTALVIIDEVEASLHPRSQRRLVHFLLKLARTKHIQVILSTHSPIVLEELPAEARVLLQRTTGGIEVVYGATPEYTLTKMDDVATPDLHIFTEDREATELAREILRHGQVDLTRLRFIEAGAGNVVQILGALAHANRLPVRAVACVDSDNDGGPGCIKLPGTLAPEREVFQAIHANAIAVLAQRCETSEPSAATALGHAMTIADHHAWITAAAQELGQTPQYLWTTMAQVYARHCLTPEQVAPVSGAVEALIPEA